MTDTQWRLDVVSHGDRLAVAAHNETGDINEARLLVHQVITRAMTNLAGPVSHDELDTHLGRALRKRAAAVDEV